VSTADLTTEYIEKRAKFKKRAESNLNRGLDVFKQLQRCANRKIYAYDEAQVGKILFELRRGLDEVEKAFATDEGETKKAWVEL
jgi:hypothetical protein